MQFKILAVATLLAGAVSASTTHVVKVGANGTLTFTPDSVVAAVGDIVEYHFYGKNHSVVQGGFTTPCQTGSVTDGFFSGFHPVSGSGQGPQVFQVTVADTTPIWVFCSQTLPVAHCPRGMVSAINAPTSGKTLAAYAAGAAAFNGTVTFPSTIQGGSLVANNATSTSGSGSGNSTVTGSSPSGTSSGFPGAAATLEGMGLGKIVAAVFGAAMLFV